MHTNNLHTRLDMQQNAGRLATIWQHEEKGQEGEKEGNDLQV